jgi:hypothetical protein
MMCSGRWDENEMRSRWLIAELTEAKKQDEYPSKSPDNFLSFVTVSTAFNFLKF